MILKSYPASLKTLSEKPIAALSVEIAKEVIHTLDTIDENNIVDINKINIVVNDTTVDNVEVPEVVVPEVVVPEVVVPEEAVADGEIVPEVAAEPSLEEEKNE
jgi:hypothetical protein